MVVLSLVQLFAANYYSFVADALARLVTALDALTNDERRDLRVLLPASGGRLRGFMWPFLERLGIDKEHSYPYSIRDSSLNLEDAAAARAHVRRLIVIDWSPHESDQRADTGHLPPRTALRTLRERFAAPGVHVAWARPHARTSLVYLQRCAAKIRRIQNEGTDACSASVPPSPAGCQLLPAVTSSHHSSSSGYYGHP